MEGARAFGSSHALHNHKNSIGRTLFIIKLYGFNIPLQYKFFPYINTPPFCITGQSVHAACHVCMPWVAALFPR